MAVEYRSGRPYYYSKVREGGKVKSVYRGGGDLALLYMLFTQQDRDEREALAEARRGEIDRARREFGEMELPVLSLCQESDAAFASFMDENGYHNHRGQWRRRRAG